MAQREEDSKTIVEDQERPKKGSLVVVQEGVQEVPLIVVREINIVKVHEDSWIQPWENLEDKMIDIASGLDYMA